VQRESFIKPLSRSAGSALDRSARYMEQMVRQGKDQDPNVKAMLESLGNEDRIKLEKELDLNWWVNNLEADLRSTEWILQKVRNRKSYAQHIYAALCNNKFQPIDVVAILKDEMWSCTWRYAGGIVADMCQSGNYLDWYCSGIRKPDEEPAYVNEGQVTDEVREDFRTLGWHIIDTIQEV